MPDLVFFDEPELRFGFGQTLEDPRDGLSLFGPLDVGRPYGIRIGAVGTKDGLRRLRSWVRSLESPITNTPSSAAMPSFPGFEATFGIPWNETPTLEIEIPDSEINQVVYIDDKYIRVYRTVEVYAKRIEEAIRQEDTTVDLWFVVIPDSVYQYGRPQSQVEPSHRLRTTDRLSQSYVKQLQSQPSFFPEDKQRAEPYYHDAHFHNQLKARLLSKFAPSQIVKESTLARYDFLDALGRPKQQIEAESAVAWNLSTATFYKAGGRPWKLSTVRKGVCYVGMAFKVDDKLIDPGNACCAAQMFLDSGDGVVFRGAIGPWYNKKRGDFHLSRDAARKLVETAVDAYVDRIGHPPVELFLHGKVRFEDEEWAGFLEGAGNSTRVVGVRIRQNRDFKLYRKGQYPVLRGLAYVENERTGYLWTKGFIPRLETYPGWDVPWPLYVDVCRGDTDIMVVLEDILALTKLNYNACIYGDGVPVTLRFADAVGEILTAGPLDVIPPLAFKHYI